MSIQIGDKVPSVTVKHLTGDGMVDLNIADHIAGKTVVIFAVPGAFTPSCDQKHLPGYVSNAIDIKAKGIDEILCVAVNDPFVMDAWAKSAGVNGKITMVPDGNAEFTTKIGMVLDARGHGLGTRSLRYMMVVKDGVVQDLCIEDAPGDVNLSSANACLSNL